MQTKQEYMCFNQTRDISTLTGSSLKLMEKFTNLRSCILSTENDFNTRLAKACLATDRLSVMWKSKLSDKNKTHFSKQQSCCIYYMGAPHGR